MALKNAPANPKLAFSRLLVPIGSALLMRHTGRSRHCVDAWKRGESLPRATEMPAIIRAAAEVGITADAVRDAYTAAKVARPPKRTEASV